MTVQQALTSAISQLTNESITDPEPSARRLLGHVLNISPTQLLASLSETLTVDQLENYQALIARRATHEPIWYLVKTQLFGGLPIFCDERVLIPRPETEQLVQSVVSYVHRHDLVAPTIIDVGTGSGAIACALAHHLPKAKLIGTDISTNALAIAKLNAERLRLNQQITFVEADLLQPLDPESLDPAAADIIVANLPYVPSGRINLLTAEVKAFEPHLALDGGTDGFDLYRRLFGQIKRLANKPEVIFCEIDESQDKLALIATRQFWPQAKAKIITDFNNLVRYFIVTF